ASEYLALLRAKPAVSAAAIYATNGALFAKYAAGEEPFPRLPEADGYRISGDEMVLFKRIVVDHEILGTVYLKARYDMGARLANYLGILVAVLLLSLGVAALLSHRLHRGITGPIRSVAGVARGVL